MVKEEGVGRNQTVTWPYYWVLGEVVLFVVWPIRRSGESVLAFIRTRLSRAPCQEGDVASPPGHVVAGSRLATTAYG